MSDWWLQPYEGGKMIDVPGLPREMYPPDASESGKSPTMSAAEVIAYKRIVARLGRWKWDPEGWDESYSNLFAHGGSDGNVGDSGIAGVQRQANLSSSNGWIEAETFNLLRSVKIPAGLPHAGEYAMDAVATQLLIDAWEAAAAAKAAAAKAAATSETAPGGGLQEVRVTLEGGAPHWGGSNDIMIQHIEPFMVARGLPIGSGKRTPAENDSVGGSATSDHLTTKSTTAARDFPTFSGEDDARALAESLGSHAWQTNSFANITFSAGGRNWRAQILWGADVKHSDHVHVGISPA